MLKARTFFMSSFTSEVEDIICWICKHAQQLLARMH
jgi:hypothetical protein